MDIDFRSVQVSDDVLTVDGVPKLPSLILQYDPPWETAADGSHFHFMPFDALADAQLTFGVASDIEAVEFHVLNHAAEAEVMNGRAKGISAMRARQVDRGMAVRGLLDQVGDALLAEVQSMDLADDDDVMMKSILHMSTEVGGGGFRAAKASFAASPMAESRRAVRSLLLEDASMHSINRKSKGYLSLDTVLKENEERIEKSRERVLESKYGREIRKMIAVRRMQENKNRKKMTP